MRWPCLLMGGAGRSQVSGCVGSLLTRQGCTMSRRDQISGFISEMMTISIGAKQEKPPSS